jgi:hypothetical protein
MGFDCSVDLTRVLDHQYDTINTPEITFTMNSGIALKAVFDTQQVVKNLFINEFSAKNDIIPDEVWEYEDWIELYNAGIDSVNLAGLFITNSFSDPYLNQIPGGSGDETMIPPGEFKLLWADGQPEQGKLHLNFTLEKSGGEIALIHNLMAQRCYLIRSFTPGSIQITLTGDMATGQTDGSYWPVSLRENPIYTRRFVIFRRKQDSGCTRILSGISSKSDRLRL